MRKQDAPRELVQKALGQCHPDCVFCARAFFVWYKDRMVNMSRRKDGMVSFAEAAVTSIRPEKDNENA